MADKKDDKKAPPAPPSLEKKIVTIIAGAILLLLVVVPTILAFFHIDASQVFDTHTVKEFLITVISKAFVFLTFICVFLSLVLFVVISYIKRKIGVVMDGWKRTVEGDGSNATHAVMSGANIPATGITLPGSDVSGTATVQLPGTQVLSHGPEAQGGNAVWLEIEQKINSMNPSDWRLAIIEADILLYEMLEQMGLPGDNLGEKLKAADPSLFTTLQEAWRAHKIRNIIAHEGASYDLSYNEARKTIDLFRRVFDEFYFI